MAMREVDAIGAAIAATENEIFGDAFGKEEVVLDETNDRSVEEMGEGLEGQHEPDDDDDTLEAEAEGEEESEDGEQEEEKPEVKEPEGKKPEAKPETKEPEGRVPPGRLREQTERAKAAEAERDRIRAELEAEKTTSRKEIDTLKTQFETVMATLRQQQPAPKPADTPAPKVTPDLFEDPTGFVNHLTEGFKTELSQRDQQIEALRVESSMGMAHVRHGDTFAKAFEAVQKLDPRNPDNQTTVRRIMTSPNPGESLVQWHRRNETLSLVGDDPAKFLEQERAKMREALMKDPEFQKQLLGSLRAEAGTAEDGRPRNITRLPGSLNGTRGGNSVRGEDLSGHDDTDSSVFSSAWRS